MTPRETREERYIEWLERLDVPLHATASIQRFQEWLRQQIDVTPARLEALWNAIQLRYERLAPIGVRPVMVEYPWGRQLRWAIKGQPGLWGWRAVEELIE